MGVSSTLLIVGSLWIAYGAIHSLLAQAIKAWVARAFPLAARGYRAIYNTVAVLTLVPILVFASRAEAESLWTWSGPWHVVSTAVAIAAAIGFLYSLRSYEMLAFLGLKTVVGASRLATTGLQSVTPGTRWRLLSSGRET